MSRDKSYGIVFSGGGALGAWEVGCYDAIKGRHGGKSPVVTTGASAGALNAVGVCAGMQPRQLQDLWARISPEDVYRFRFSVLDALPILLGARRYGLLGSFLKVLERHGSLHDTSPLKATLRNSLGGYWNSFAQSATHFALSVTNLNNRRREYFYKVPVGFRLPEAATKNRETIWERIDGLELLLDSLIA
jgi:predicted acylesterase/phospholipase RssA